MERLETSLDDLLELMPNLPLSLKRSVLDNVACGLLYLHDRQPPVIHRDLTSKNVLLTSSLVAKITDMGNSRIVTMRPGQLAKTLTKYPGTLVYMPPEAQDDTHRYGTSIDVFSFGHLALYTLTQKFPGDLLPSTYLVDPENSQEVRGRTEIERREPYINLLEARISSLSLVELVKQCLQNNPRERPITEQLLTRLQKTRRQVEGEYGGPVKLDMVRLRFAKAVKEKDQVIDELTQQQARLETDLEEARRNGEELTRVLEDSAKREAGLRKELELQANEMARLREALRKFDEIPRKKSLELPFMLTWRRGPDMPFDMAGYIQSVLIQDKLYIGGGISSPSKNYPQDNDSTVMEYDALSGEWTLLPKSEVRYFALTAISDNLVLVGGRDWQNFLSKKLRVLRPGGKVWECSYPDLPTARHSPSTIAYKQWLVVAGGWAGQRLSRVDILDIVKKQWYTGPPTPIPWSFMKTAVVEDVGYFMSGADNTGVITERVYSISLEKLISMITSQGATVAGNVQIWKETSPLKLTRSTPLCFNGSLLAVGGLDNSIGAITDICLYQPDSGEWVKIGDLPSARYNCTCAVINEELLVAGGENETIYLITVDMAVILSDSIHRGGCR